MVCSTTDTFWMIPSPTQQVKPQNHLHTTTTEPSNSTYIRHIFISYMEPQPMAQEHFVD